MKKNNVNYKTTFTFAFILCLTLIICIIWYQTSADEYTNYTIYTADSVSGLIVDAPIEFHGVEVGLVKEIELINPHLVRLLLNIKKTAPITRATVATITARGVATRGFTGYVYISLEDSGKDIRPLVTAAGQRYPIITAAPAKIVSLDTTLNQMNQNMQKITQSLQSLLDQKTIISLKQLITNLQPVLETLAENNKKLNSIIVNTQQASEQFKPLIQSSNDLIKTLQTQILPSANSAISNLNNLSSSVKNVTTILKQDPSILIRGTTASPPGPGESK